MENKIMNRICSQTIKILYLQNLKNNRVMKVEEIDY